VESRKRGLSSQRLMWDSMQPMRNGFIKDKEVVIC
jgi:hypothetical protein